MADYGIAVSKEGKSALTSNTYDLLMNTKNPFAKIDPTNLESFRTTTVTFLTDTPDNVKTQIASFAHGYDYMPQVWGIWNVTWSPSLTGLTQNGYGSLTNTSGLPQSTLSYEADDTNIYLFLYKGWEVLNPTNAIGTIATLTTYIFVDDTEDM